MGAALSANTENVCAGFVKLPLDGGFITGATGIHAN